MRNKLLTLFFILLCIGFAQAQNSTLDSVSSPQKKDTRTVREKLCAEKKNSLTTMDFLNCDSLVPEVTAAKAQTEGKSKLITWSKETSCGEVNFILTKTDFLKCDSFISEGQTIYVVSYNGIFIATSFIDTGDNIVADVYVSNNTDGRVLVNAAKFGMFHYKSEEDFETGKRELYTGIAIPPDQIAKKVLSRIRWANALADIGASMQRRITVVNKTSLGNATITDNHGNSAKGIYSGTSQSTVTTPDYEAQARTQNQNAARSEKGLRKAQGIMDNALLSNTLFEGGKINGLVYFKRKKKANFSIAFFDIGNMTFMFDLGKEK